MCACWYLNIFAPTNGSCSFICIIFYAWKGTYYEHEIILKVLCFSPYYEGYFFFFACICVCVCALFNNYRAYALVCVCACRYIFAPTHKSCSHLLEVISLMDAGLSRVSLFSQNPLLSAQTPSGEWVAALNQTLLETIYPSPGHHANSLCAPAQSMDQSLPSWIVAKLTRLSLTRWF